MARRYGQLEPLEPICVVGMGLRLPGAESPSVFWDNLRAGRAFVGDASVEQASAGPRPHAPPGRLERVDGFDWRAFRVSPREARYMDPQHRLLLELTGEALEDAGIAAGELRGSRTSVHVGVQWNDYLRLHSRGAAPLDSFALTGNLFNFAANRISHVFGLVGPSMAVDMGCASALAAVHAACQALRLGECDRALAGAVELVLGDDGSEMMQRAGLLDPRGGCRTLDASADGFCRGEGAVVLVLQRERDVAAADRPYAAILGSAVNHNGANTWITAPSSQAQRRVVVEAWERAGVSGGALDYVELHGTASVSGDATEAEALGAALAETGGERGRPLRVGSVKTQIGHLGAAAGLAGLAKVALALHHGELPAGLAVERLNPGVDLDELGLALQSERCAWPAREGQLALAGVTATSLSGANAHVVLQGRARAASAASAADTASTASETEERPRYLPLSARTEGTLRELCAQVREQLTQSESGALADIAYTAGARREHHAERFCARGSRVEQWVAALDRFLAGSGDGADGGDGDHGDDAICAAYRRGEAIDWAALAPAGGRLVSLPCTPWQRSSLWLPEADAGAAADAGAKPVEPARVLARALARTLGLPEARLGEDSVPVALGLDSLRAQQIAHELERELGVRLDARVLLGGSLAAAARALEAAWAARQNEKPEGEAAPGDAAPLSAGQRALYFHHALTPSSAEHNVVLPLELVGPLDVAALRQALEATVARHPMLRARFEAPGGEPVQRVAPRAELPWREVEAHGLSPAELLARLVGDGLQPFDLRAAPPLRTTLYRQTPALATDAASDAAAPGEAERAEQGGLDEQDGLAGAPTRSVLLLVAHHIALDFWSLALLLDELDERYAAFEQGRAPRLSPAGASYLELAAEQQAHARTAEAAAELRACCEALAGLAPLSAPTPDMPRPAQLPRRGAACSFEVDAALASRVRTLAAEGSATLFVALFGAFEALLSGVTRGAEVAIGTPTAGRGAARFARTVGHFVNPVVLRGRVDAQQSFKGLLADEARRVGAALARAGCPFSRVVAELGAARSSSHHPLFQVMFALQQSPLAARPELSAFARCDSGARGRLGTLEMRGVGLPERAVQFDLNLMLAPRGDGLVGTLEYNGALYRRETAERMARGYVALLERLVAEPDAPLASLIAEVVGGRARAAIASAGDEPAVEPAVETVDAPTVCQRFAEQVARRGDAPAVIDAGGDALSYRALGTRVERLARGLAVRGIGRGDVVAVDLAPSVDHVASALAALWVGAAYLPIDVRSPAQRARWMADDADAALVIGGGGARWLGSERPQARVAELEADASRATSDAAGHATEARADDLAYVMYTSGSTGRPKGVMVGHDALAAQLRWREGALPLGGDDRVLLLASPAFDIFIWELLAPLAAGAQLVIAPAEARHDSRQLAELVATRHVTALQLTSSALARLLDEPSFARDGALRAVFCGGDPLLGEVAAELRRRCDAVLWHLYGATETAIDATCLRWDGEPAQGRVPIGEPIAGGTVVLLDEELQPVPRGTVGEICVGGLRLARGYLGRPELTASRFVADPVRPGARLYRSGDLGCVDERGLIELRGRRDQQVKVRGYRVELGEVEAALARHGDVAAQAVLTRELGGQLALVGYVAPRPEATLLPSALRAHLAAALPDYMVPAALVVLPALPLLPSGKVDREALVAREVARAPGRRADAPRTHAEQMVAEVWAELLRREHVGAEESFFELGGHSLLALQAAARLSACAAVEVPVSAVFERPTPRALAALIDERHGVASGGAAPPLLPDSADEGPLSFAQEGMWLLDRFEGDARGLAVQQAYRLRGALDREALARAIADVRTRHAALRTAFEARGDEPLQRVLPAPTGGLPYEDLRGHDAEQQRRVLDERRAALAANGLDLAAGTLLRAEVLQLGDDEHALLLDVHHIGCDGWSQTLVLDELAARYRAHSDGDAVEPPEEVTPRYVDYARWQRGWLAGERLARLERYWRERLAGAKATRLPRRDTTAPEPPSESAAGQGGQTCCATLDAELVAALRARCRESDATLFMGLLATFAVVLHRFVGETDLLIGTPMSVRDQPQLEGVVGNFINTLLLRVELARGEDFRGLLARVRDEALGAYAHRHCPFERVVKGLGAERRAGEIPLLGVMFQLQTQPVARLELPGLAVEPLDDEEEAGLAVAPLYPILTLTPREDALAARFDFAAARCSRQSARQLLAWYERTARELCQRPDAPVGELLRRLERGDDAAPLEAAQAFAFERLDERGGARG